MLSRSTDSILDDHWRKREQRRTHIRTTYLFPREKSSGSIDDDFRHTPGGEETCGEENRLAAQPRYLPDVLFSDDEQRRSSSSGLRVFERCHPRDGYGWILMDARSNDESRARLEPRAAALLFLSPSFLASAPSFSPYVKAVISRGSIPVAFMIYRCSRLSFAVSYAGLARYIFVARALLLLYDEYTGPRGAFRRLDNWV